MILARQTRNSIRLGLSKSNQFSSWVWRPVYLLLYWDKACSETKCPKKEPPDFVSKCLLVDPWIHYSSHGAKTRVICSEKAWNILCLILRDGYIHDFSLRQGAERPSPLFPLVQIIKLKSSSTSKTTKNISMSQPSGVMASRTKRPDSSKLCQRETTFITIQSFSPMSQTWATIAISNHNLDKEIIFHPSVLLWNG